MVLDYIAHKSKAGEKLLAILVDPDNLTSSDDIEETCINLAQAKPDLIFVGGSLINNGKFETVVKKLHALGIAPVVIFPGNNKQISSSADAILLLSLLSGRNAEFLIGQHVTAAFELRQSELEIISTGYILIDCGNKTTAAYMSNTQPVPYYKNGIASATALAGEQLGNKIVYLDGGSGAMQPIATGMIESVKKTLTIPLIVGGGIRTSQQAMDAWDSGADVIVIGTAFEENPDFVSTLNSFKTNRR